MERPTQYDIELEELGIVDREEFFNNIKKLAKVNENANLIYKELKIKKNNFIEIPKDLDIKQLGIKINKYYCVFSSITSPMLYRIVQVKFNYEYDKNLDIFDTEAVLKWLYKAYTEDYNKFIETIHEYMIDPSKWGEIPEEILEERRKESNARVKKHFEERIKSGVIPEVPFVPT